MRRVKFVLGWSCLLLIACKVDLQPTCSPSAKVEVNDSAGDGRPGTEPKSETRACPGPRHSGKTVCFPGDCSPGMYCDDPTSTCNPGCVSDANCGPRDTCIRPEGDPVGRCESCADHEAHEPAEHCVDARRTGTTECFPGNCVAGQYCVNRGLNHCEAGCVSNDNCSATERCVRADGEAVGICRSCFFD